MEGEAIMGKLWRDGDGSGADVDLTMPNRETMPNVQGSKRDDGIM